MFVTDSKPVSLKYFLDHWNWKAGGKGDLPDMITGVDQKLQNAKGDLPDRVTRVYQRL